MMEETLEDDNIEVFKGGTLEIAQEVLKPLGGETSVISSDYCGDKQEARDNELNANIDDKSSSNSRVGFGSNLIDIPKRISETLWSCKNNNQLGELSESTDVLPTAIPPDPGSDASDYFTFRDGVVEHAAQDCVQQLVQEDMDGDVIATFLLTEVTLWDTEKERLVILTGRSVISVKYDFIALKQLEFKRIHLDSLDSLVLGDLVYPSASLVPRLNGFATGVTGVMKGCLLERWSKTDQKYVDSSLFQPRDRKTRGIRLQWNRGAPVGFTQRWNPFSNDAPLITFISHPLHQFAHEHLNESQRAVFSADEFGRQLVASIEQLHDRCLIQHKEIVVQAYLGLGSLIYNRNSLGFFKVRGKFSF